MVSSLDTLVDSFNTFFQMSADFSSSSDSSLTLPACTYIEEPWNISPVNELEVVKAVKLMQNKYSAGFDDIPIAVIKPVIHLLSFPLANIINASLSQGSFPSLLKQSNIQPIHKKGAKTSFNNYRPIALLSSFSKIIEKVINLRLNSYLIESGILTDEQFGFRERRSTTDAVNNFLHTVYMNLEGKIPTAAIFFDLSKAFDSVNHRTLLQKLQHYGFRGKTLNWFKSYLDSRTQRVKLSGSNEFGVIRNYLSDPLPVLRGVPQGSTLGPTLFLLYINDIKHAIPGAEVTLFADDTAILVHDKDISLLLNKVSTLLTSVSQWFSANSLSLNISKTFYMPLVCPRLFSSISTLSLNQTSQITSTETLKYLGLTIDHQLNWNAHITNVISRLCSAIYLIKTIRLEIGLESAKLVYHSNFHSIMEYGISFWGGSSSAVSVFKLQKRAIRAFLKRSNRSSCRGLFRENQILTFYGSFILRLLLLVYSHLDQFPTPNHPYSTRGRNRHLLIPRLDHSTYYYLGVTCYNKLPETLITTDQGTFGTLLKDKLIQLEPYSIQEFLSADMD